MAVWLNGWAGDNAGPVVGRKPNTLLVAVTYTDGTYPTAVFKSGGLSDLSDDEKLKNLKWYYEIYVHCLIPDSRFAFVIDVDQKTSNMALALTLAEVDFNDGRTPWAAGVQLFSVAMAGGVGSQSATICTAKIADVVRISVKPTARKGGPLFSPRHLQDMFRRPGEES